MRLVVQRVTRASVEVDGRVVGSIGKGLLVLLGISPDDTDVEVDWAADKIANLRVLADDDGKMNRSVLDIGGEALVVSQFTLYGDARKGRRPSFVRAAEGPEAAAVYKKVVERLRKHGVATATGEFGAMMDVHLTNAGPVTILLDSDKQF